MPGPLVLPIEKPPPAGSAAADGGEEVDFAVFVDALEEADLAGFAVDDYGYSGLQVILLSVVEDGFDAGILFLEVVDDLAHGAAADRHPLAAAGQALHRGGYPHFGHTRYPRPYRAAVSLLHRASSTLPGFIGRVFIRTPMAL